MLDQEQLLELTESYLKSIVAEASPSLGRDFDSSAPFGELGIDSFRVLKIIKGLEADFGTLPKTLLFENFNVEALARYFVDKHGETLVARFSKPMEVSRPAPVVTQAEAVVKAVEKVPGQDVRTTIRQAPVTPTKAASAPPKNTPIRLIEKDLPRHPELEALVQDLFERHKNEGCVSRGTRNIAPNLFIGSARRGYFNYCRSRNIILVYAYTGPAAYFEEIAQEMHDYCVGKGFQLNIFIDSVIEAIGNTPFSSTPFGALQRVLNIKEFTLEGGAMRRLRYQVSKFEKSGACRTVEYKCGTDKAVDRNIAEIIDLWCETKTMVNPLIHTVKEEILAGTLDPQHRIFLTYADEVLQNVILITAMCREFNGYLMDLEFYPKSMPLGGLEYAIVKIIEALAAEGCDMLSLGGTHGCRITTSANADPELDRILDDLHKQNIFNDDGNLQFKNKFRPENRAIYLCRPVGSGHADNVIDIIMMIADPAKTQTSDEENHNAAGDLPLANDAAASTAPVIEGEARSRELATCGFNPLNIPSEQVEFDLKTDSWAQLDAAFVTRQMGHLRVQLQQPVNASDSLKAVFPFEYFVLTDSGRTAEHVFCTAWPKKGIVLQNLLFPTGIYHQIDKGFTPRELPHPTLFQPESTETCKANLCWDDLQAQVAQHTHEIAFVCIEISDNAAGGLPVSIRHLRQVKELLAGYSIPLVIDGTRIVENARFLIEQDAEYAGRTTWEVAREILSCADVVIGSLAKDFCVDKGGVIATNDETLLRRLQEVIQRDGGGLNVIDKKLIALSLKNRHQIEAQVVRRMQATRTVWDTLKAESVPVAEPVGGHCVLIDVKRIPAFANFQNAVASFLAWLYLGTGIRAGAHSVGMQKGTAINDQVRLAIPVGLKQDQVNEVAGRLVRLFRERKNIPELCLRGTASESFGDIHAHYDLIRYHNAAPAAPVAASTMPTPPAPVAMPEPSETELPRRPESAGADSPRPEIAIVGMAGRYPQAQNIQEFWENLREGRDCVGEFPPDRIARRLPNAFTQAYRGGFIDGIDKFDSLFFSISPREAEVLDPQERLFLEVAWEALEDAGYYPEILAPENAPRDVGVFVGAVWAMYQIMGVEEKLTGNNANPNSFLWSIANRVSYWMNLTGPSLTVDTACSSSLTALHLACEAIQNGHCSSAIVGGVNLDLHQHKFDINHSGGALSIDGLCRSFGAGANGYVAGEGVGAIFIKPLAKALEDNDQIYGVIKSAVVNHGGRTSGYTVPNPKAQGELIATALEKAGVDARTIGYIEAHGTGTELGDPIEISGLTQAFGAYQVSNQTCSIGSVKTNIGHLEAAAGVVGVCKVLLQIKHRQLVPSLHSAQLNEHIDFAGTPFYVQQHLEAWKEKVIGGVRLPLRAGISSFGAGGANAHIVVEQYELPRIEADAPPNGYIFPLSARNEEQLREMAIRLRRHLELEPVSLADIAFTLRNGRKSFEHRLAIVATSRKRLVAKLGLYLEGGKDADVLSGHAKNADGITKLLNRKEKEQFVGLLSQSRDPRKLAQLWIDGLLSDCRGFPQTGGRRTSLPTYPFADKRHWIGTGKTATTAASLQARAGVHPLIDSNESTFHRQLFRKTFHAQEFFLRDHIVSGIPTLPGTAYLDLARKVGEIAAGRKVQKIRNVTWVSPLSVEGSTPIEALIELKPSADAVIFEVFSEAADGKKKLYSQGKLVYANEHVVESEPETIDIAAIRARCTTTIAGQDAYPLFDSVGLNYGPSFQVLQEVYKNQDEVLGLLKLPDVRNADFDQFMLHPCILDASMQAGVVGQLVDASGEMKVPYSIGEVELLHPLTRTCYSYVKKASGDRNTGSGVSRENVVIVDENGKVLARIRESIGVPLVSVHERPVTVRKDDESAKGYEQAKPMPVQSEDGFVKLYYSPFWEQSPLDAVRSDAEAILLFDVNERLRDAWLKKNKKVALVLPGKAFADFGNGTYAIDPRSRMDYARLFEALGRTEWTPGKICFAWGDAAVPDNQAALGTALERGVYAFLFLCQALIERKLKKNVQLLYRYFAEDDSPLPHHQAMSGFARSLRLERPRIDCKVLEIHQNKADPNDLPDTLLTELHSGAQDDVTVRYEGRVRYTRTLRKLDRAELEATASPGIALKQNGVYLITGGAGGLGLIFAEFLAQQCRAKLVLTGRSALSAEHEARFEALIKAGAEVLYVPADVSKRDDVMHLLQETRLRFGGLNGIIHSAGVLRDSLVSEKTQEDMTAVLAPKIYGTFHLDELTRDDDLDFFVLFSSLAAFGNAGQCDYSFANHYLDAFAARREGLRAKGERSGRTLSLNWSLWADGGMKLDEPTERFFKTKLGIKPLATAFGLEAFANSLSSAYAQVAVLEGVQTKIEHAWGIAKQEAVAPVPSPSDGSSTATGEDIAGAVTQELSNVVMDLLKLSAEDLSLDSILLDLGFDSIGLTTFANAINDKYQLDINPTLFFEYPSIRAIAGVLATEHESAVRKIHSGGMAVARSASPASVALTVGSDTAAYAPLAIIKNWLSREPEVGRGDFSREHRFADMPIAIVGIGGVMPQSANLEEFWDNLKNARNMVTEIPRERWIWEEYDGNPIKEVNKSNSRWGGFLKEVDRFDPLFFGITPREAEMMDPQQRIFIETVWSAIEDSGHKVSDLSCTKTGVFVGVSAKDYVDVLAEQQSTLDGFSASGNSHSILANRISFLLNLRGPSAPLDTACSSSLIALHRAIESIHTGSSDMAIVGGVQIMLTPVGHISLSSAGMLSPDGKCKTFDKDANGYVRGEGAGAIFIKPLAQAEQDGNPIYAVIKATAENHGGRVTMLTAPNPKAQAELLIEAYEKAQIDPTTVGYIECHGTGTSLGDPIEIQALKKSFSDLYAKHGKTAPRAAHCGLSSVKTNIGHLEPAAGIASLLKVLLSIKHQQIPALLHFETLNPYIDLEGSPFYIVDQTRPWEAIKGLDGAPLPRRAGVSSFGWGGANAHVVLEEYLPPERPACDGAGPQLVVLSARNSARLEDYARTLLAHIQKREIELADLAYTLQVGRDPMEERLGLVVESIGQLEQKLEAFIAGEPNVDGLHCGHVARYKQNDQGLSVESDGESEVRAEYIAEWVATRNYPKLLAAWVNGADVDWVALHPTGPDRFTPKRVSLPTYPFARDRHWITTSTNKEQRAGAASVALHPLLHSNTSTLDQQRYTTTFSGKEFFLVDHQQTLPAMAYLEMARAAVAHAKPMSEDSSVLELRNAEWALVTGVSGRVPVVVDVFAGRDGRIDYEIHSAEIDGEVHPRRVVLCQGSARHTPHPSPTRLDLAQLKALMTYGEVDENRLDAVLASLMPHRGARLRTIKAMYRGYRQALVRLELPAGLEASRQEYVLHPSIMDGVLQGTVALATGLDPDQAQASPLAGLGSLRVLSACTSPMYAWVRFARGSDAGSGMIAFDVDVTDSDGAVCVKMKSLALASPSTKRAGEVRSEDFAALLDAVYQAEPPADVGATAGATDDEFEKILEEFL